MPAPVSEISKLLYTASNDGTKSQNGTRGCHIGIQWWIYLISLIVLEIVQDYLCMSCCLITFRHTDIQTLWPLVILQGPIVDHESTALPRNLPQQLLHLHNIQYVCTDYWEQLEEMDPHESGWQKSDMIMTLNKHVPQCLIANPTANYNHTQLSSSHF